MLNVTVFFENIALKLLFFDKSSYCDTLRDEIRQNVAFDGVFTL